MISGKLEPLVLTSPFFYEKWLVRISDSDRSIKLVLVVKKNALAFFDVHLFLINGKLESVSFLISLFSLKNG
ncbi:MAG: hypothetical protein ACOC40_01705 [Thermoplasmatota archaeon]